HTDISGLEEVTVEDGESLVLQCHMRANPMVTSVTWKLNGSLVDLLTSSFIITSDGITSKLQINKVERSLHEGLYQFYNITVYKTSPTQRVTSPSCVESVVMWLRCGPPPNSNCEEKLGEREQLQQRKDDSHTYPFAVLQAVQSHQSWMGLEELW
ncbi:hypothetical protein XENORESO_006909, partial [Xenotaenia resolanae]